MSQELSLIDSIHHSVILEHGMSEKLEQLSSATRQIKGVLEIISDISDQTNLLALNAAIETAHAGEQMNKNTDSIESLSDISKSVKVLRIISIQV
ncbi:MAG: hypothetical protein SPLUMA2_SPLUMAMAG2_00071 [uncultured Sulfurimonas sp.]|nr:MAG: hypothetical protein SPLUMA1_SPLUMAMAG1_00975 [uncultured Sulfurimonas sp.]CAI6151069.1 MAG: hypothetical protein SPLUMA2_SPLUMAMAG2_00071 [uncultured Sulfurimonas sp.]